MRRPGRGVWIAAGGVVLVAVFIVASLSNSERKKRGVEVRFEAVKRDRIESWVRAPGRVQAERLVQVSSNVTGRIRTLAVREGDAVQSGDLLLELDDERYRSAVAGHEALVQAAAADLELADAQASLSRQTLLRQEKLLDAGLVSSESIESVRTQARVDAARVTSAREELRRRRASLEEARKDLQETVFRAPIDGMVTALNVEVGENVITGTMNNPGTVILTVADLDTMEVEAEVDETDVVRVRPGLTARIEVDAWEDTTLAGVVRAVGMSGRRGSTGQQQGTSFKVEVRILGPAGDLRPGMSAEVEVLAGQADSALVVPIQALTAQPERIWARWQERRERPSSRSGSSRRKAAEDEADTLRAGRNEKLIDGVFLHRDGRAVFVPVVLGLRGDTMIEVGGDLKAGDEVITGPYRTLRSLKDQDPVRREKTKGKKGPKGGAEAR